MLKQTVTSFRRFSPLNLENEALPTSRPPTSLAQLQNGIGTCYGQLQRRTCCTAHRHLFLAMKEFRLPEFGQ